MEANTVWFHVGSGLLLCVPVHYGRCTVLYNTVPRKGTIDPQSRRIRRRPPCRCRGPSNTVRSITSIMVTPRSTTYLLIASMDLYLMLSKYNPSFVIHFINKINTPMFCKRVLLPYVAKIVLESLARDFAMVFRT